MIFIRTTRVGILSDTHDRLSEDTIQALTGCDYILHAGDVTFDRILDELRPLGRIYVVRGNNDYGRWAQDLSRRLSFEIEGVRFLMVHERFRAGDASGSDVVIYGHTHQFRLEQTDGTAFFPYQPYRPGQKTGQIWLNPGSCERPRYGTGRTLAIMTLAEGRVTDIRKITLR